MGRKKWTTSEQDDWLSKRIPSFVQAQKNKTISQFFVPVYSEFHEAWPCPEPSQEEIEANGGDKAKAEAVIFKKENTVSTYFPIPYFNSHYYISGFIGGFSTIRVRQRRGQTREMS
jgi:hypothetical protein